jgi:opacity protein-like surface antigen
MKKQIALAIVLAIASSAAVAAEGISHTYIEGGYARQRAEAGVEEPGASIDDLKLDGGYIAGSVELNEDFYLFGGYQKGSDDISVNVPRTLIHRFDDGFEIWREAFEYEIDVDVQQANVGFGYRHKLSDRVEWTGELGYLNTRLKLKAEDMKESAKGDDYRASLGLRGALASNFEGWVKVNYTDGDIYDGEVSGTVGALVKFNEMWGIVGEADFGEHNRRYNLGVRVSF